MEFMTSYPFNNITIEQIKKVNEGFNYDVINNGHSIYYDYNNKNFNKDDNELLGYFLFLNQLIKRYDYTAKECKASNMDVPNVYEFLNAVITNINEEIDKSIDKKERPFPVDIFIQLTIGKEYYEYLNLFDVIEILLNSKGYELIPGDLYNIRENQKITSNLELKVNDLISRSNKPKIKQKTLLNN